MTHSLEKTSLLLTPDASAGRQIRRIVAERKLGLGVKVVTWPELIEEVRLAHLLPPLSDDWSETVQQVMVAMGDGFWWQSFEVDPIGTATAVAFALDEAIRHGGRGDSWTSPSLPARTNRTLSDLKRLWEQTKLVLPPELRLIEAVRENPERAITQFSVHWIVGWPRLDRHQSELLGLLNARGEEADGTLLGILRDVSSLPVISETSPAPQRLAHLCFSGRKGELRDNDDIGYLVARDPLQEAE